MNLGIVGHKGFIGGALFELFSLQGFSVYPIVPMQGQSFGLIDYDLNNILVPLDYVIHAGGRADVSASFAFPEVDFSKNTLAVFNLLEALRNSQHKDAGFIFLSSAAVYGEPAELPILVTSPVKPISPYGFHKAMAEMLVSSFSTCFGMRSLSLRIFSAYGVGNKKQVLWELCKKCFNSTDSTLFVEGTGKETRDFIHVDDIANQINLLIENAPFNGEAYNVANGCEISINELADIIAVEFNISKIQFSSDIRTGYPQKWIADISFLKKHGYKQKVNFIDGVLDYCNWFKSINING